MGKNLIPLIAGRLGVEIGEEFHIENLKTGEVLFEFDEGFVETDRLCVFKFDDNSLVQITRNDSDATRLIGYLASGRYGIVKIPFESNSGEPFVPKVGQPYWTYTGGWEPDWEMKWCGVSWELMALKAGCVFRSKEEALAARPEVYKSLTGKEWSDGQND